MMSHSDKKHPYNDPGYPPYPTDEDIYNQEKVDKKKDPENTSNDKKEKEADEDKGPEDPETATPPEEDLDEGLTTSGNRMGEGLDVPGAERDDEDEDIGEEDEENNYYSLGGDKNPEDNRDPS